MIQEIQDEIKLIKDNINTLPKNNKTNIQKFKDYVDDIKDKYNNKFKNVSNEILDRYNKLTVMETVELTKESLDYEFLNLVDSNTNSYEKMGLDYKIYKLKYFYKDNLKEINDLIREIINNFKGAGIKLTIKDFKYTIYVEEYMKVILEDKSDEEIHTVFEKVYWKCPELIIQISLAFRNIYRTYEKKLDKYYSKLIKSSKTKGEYLNEHEKIIDNNRELMHSNEKYILYKFFNHEFLIKDYQVNNIDKLKETLFSNVDDKNNYGNLMKLSQSLIEYREYLNYLFIIDDIKEIYKNKSTFKGKYSNKLKEIIKKEKELSKFNKKLSVSKDSKYGESKLKFDNIISELIKLYDEYDSIKIENEVFEKVNDDTSIEEIFNIAASNYIYMVKLLKINNDNITIEEIKNEINKLKKYLYETDFNMINNINITHEKDIANIIYDRYKLIGINLTLDDLLKENIDNILNNISILINYYDIDRLNIRIEDIEFILTVKEKYSEIFKEEVLDV